MSIAEAVVEDTTYEMPPVSDGMIVLWYDHNLLPTRPQVGLVLNTNPRTRRTVQMYLPASGATKVKVRHVSDPKLKESQEHREDGAWDYTPEYKQHKDRMSQLMSRLDQLERSVMRRQAAKE